MGALEVVLEVFVPLLISLYMRRGSLLSLGSLFGFSYVNSQEDWWFERGVNDATTSTVSDRCWREAVAYDTSYIMQSGLPRCFSPCWHLASGDLNSSRWPQLWYAYLTPFRGLAYDDSHDKCESGPQDHLQGYSPHCQNWRSLLDDSIYACMNLKNAVLLYETWKLTPNMLGLTNKVQIN